jgi:hypothetical protein
MASNDATCRNLPAIRRSQGRDIEAVEMPVPFSYPLSMRRWFCALLLILFAVNFGLAHHGMTTFRTLAATKVGESGGAQTMNNVAQSMSRCCMEKQTAGQSKSSRCSADCTFSIVTAEYALPRALQDHDIGIVRSEWPRYAGAVFRPPIA